MSSCRSEGVKITLYVPIRVGKVMVAEIEAYAISAHDSGALKAIAFKGPAGQAHGYYPDPYLYLDKSNSSELERALARRVWKFASESAQLAELARDFSDTRAEREDTARAEAQRMQE